MFYEIEKHIPNILNTIEITDDEGEVVYEVDSRLILNKRIIRFYNSEDELVSNIERVIPSFEPRYTIVIEGQQIGELVKEFTFFEPRVHIISEYGPIISTGDMVGLEFQLLDENAVVLAQVSDDLTEDEDTYGVEIDDEADELFILCLLMVIDVLLNEGNE